MGEISKKRRFLLLSRLVTPVREFISPSNIVIRYVLAARYSLCGRRGESQRHSSLPVPLPSSDSFSLSFYVFFLCVTITLYYEKNSKRSFYCFLCKISAEQTQLFRVFAIILINLQKQLKHDQ